MTEIETTLRIHMGAIYSNADDRGDYFSLEITDERSGQQFLSIDLTMEQFARLITSRGDISGAPVTLRGMDKIGTKHERKTVEIEFASSEELQWGDDYMAAVRERVKEFEVDGWQANAYDLKGFNGHRLKRDTKAGVERYSVGFDRWVPWSDEG